MVTRPTALQVRHGLMRSLRGQLPEDGRKTFRRQGERLAPHVMPDWRVTIGLPGALAFSIAPGSNTGVIAVAVAQDPAHGPTIEATGKDCQWLFGQIAAYLGKVANGWQGRLHLRAQRGAYPGCTEGAPLRPAVDRAQDVYLVMEPSLVIPRGHREPLILKVGK
jgi:hypothetical protein